MVWQHTGFSGRFKASLLEGDQSRVIPDQKVVLVATASAAEGHYLAAVLNSKPVEHFLRSFILLDVSPVILEHLRIAKFDPQNETHLGLSRLGVQAKNLCQAGDLKGLAEIESQLDHLLANALSRQTSQ